MTPTTYTRKGSFDVEGTGSFEGMRYVLDYEWLDNDVLMVEHAFPFNPAAFAEQADLLAKWSSATVVYPTGEVKPDKAHRDTEEFTLWCDDEAAEEFFDYASGVMLAVNAMASIYRRANPFATAQHVPRCSVLRYGPGGFLDLHVDTLNRDQERAGAQRVISFVGFLNAVEEGGVLEFPRQGLQIVPAPGRAVMFPSGYTHPHVSLPVVRGTKRAVVSWMH